MNVTGGGGGGGGGGGQAGDSATQMLSTQHLEQQSPLDSHSPSSLVQPLLAKAVKNVGFRQRQTQKPVCMVFFCL